MTDGKFENLMQIMYKLRKECPWDKEQTHDSIKAATLEESYEVVEAIDEKNFDELKVELGDLLLHIVFHSIIAEEADKFTISDVIDSITDKLIRRHPHVFGDTKVNGTSDITRNWETIKLSEGRKSILEGVPKNLPELHKSFRLQEKAAKVGFDWEKKEDVWKKVEEEIRELQAEEKKGESEKLEEEMGDLLFSIVNYSRFIGINPENALRRTNEKFVRRFNYVESKLKENGKNISESNLEEMDKYWEESKNKI
ncbi:MAG: nucleoside triphosphate pyrophosphohydrolase [Melioribacteraceae bacterium]|nr:nucleoside triphosphate pyrophosphohydrolase [Melioribacteraceae bacterium]